MSENTASVVVRPRDLRLFVRRLLEAAGGGADAAEVAAQTFLEADLKGVGGQGADYLFYVIESLKRGLIDGTAVPELVREGTATALIDGNRGLGQQAAVMAAVTAAEKAREHGSATVVVRNSTDIFLIGAYAERIARFGLIGMVMTSGPPLVHPHGGVERMLSTNPIAIAIPRRSRAPLLLDMATSTVSSSRARLAAYRGEDLPPGSGIGPDGKATTDARAVREGALSPLGGHKGYGLSLCVAILCGPLSGSGVGPELAGWQAEGETRTQGHYFYALDPRRFGDFDEFLGRTEWYLGTIKQSARAEGVEEIRVPGERGFRTRRERKRAGVRLLRETWDTLGRYSSELGVPLPSPS